MNFCDGCWKFGQVTKMVSTPTMRAVLVSPTLRGWHRIDLELTRIREFPFLMVSRRTACCSARSFSAPQTSSRYDFVTVGGTVGRTSETTPGWVRRHHTRAKVSVAAIHVTHGRMTACHTRSDHIAPRVSFAAWVTRGTSRPQVAY